MNITEWDKKFELGVKSLDREHKQLFSIVKKLLKLIESPDKSEFACQEGIKYLNSHTIEHFAHEEEYMQSIGYSDYKIHKRIHDNFRNTTLPALKEELNEMHYSDSAVRHFIGVVIGWLVSHTITADMAIVGKNVKKWTNVPPEKQLDALEQAVIQTLFDMFRVKAKTVSTQYEGEDFGRMICISLTYRGKKDGKWKIVISFEERMLLSLVSELLNTKYRKCDDMVINIMRHTARQFVENVKAGFSILDLYEVESEMLMTYSDLAEAYEEDSPAFSMLFDTGRGYFAFSVTAAVPIQDENEGAKKEEDVTSDIWRYLNSGHKKKKILVVDDSDFMRLSIIKLLENDYEVLECGSALSAIIKLATDSPDLVILDYEMPICDGRQMLEMLRSEPETMNIPVIFLTGHDDSDSIQKVMALNPSGYLLKSKPKEYIKKTIDGFFAAQQNGKT